MNGNREKSLRILAASWVVWCLLAVMGCGTSPSWSKRSTPLVTDQPQRERLFRDREAELAGLRADVANARIAAAKKEAEVQELREQVIRLRQELGVAYQQLAEERTESGKFPGDSRSFRDGAALNGDPATMKHIDEPPRSKMDTLLRNLTTEVEGLKRQIQTVQDAQQVVAETHARETRGLTGRVTSPSIGEPPIQSLAIGFVGDATQSVTVDVGDTLADVAERYHTSEIQLQQLNVLEGKSLSPGQVLLVPVPSVEGP
ncbi:MAG: LysM peptidoglycan-binding domain-containing protein [Nitrospira sp.]|jgi:LysM repeat protein|nr:LysM peptidoglycan-binding domain-containing protein [Nitrospira sp.]